jgi:hypothetical protein
MSTVIFLTGWSMAQGASTIAGCPIFPADNVWNTPIDHLPVDSHSSAYITSIGATTGLHPDFGTIWEGAPIGIPYNIVPGTQPRVSITFDYDDESDPGPYPIPPDAVIEDGDASTGDRHILVLDEDNCILYETFYSWPQKDGSWQAGSGAVYDLHSNTLRPSGWTSADAAGIPILPGLVRYDEVASGEITHALRFTVQHTRKAFIWPARHYASSLTSTNYPPMGQRFRLKASFDISGFSPEVQVILRALRKYGMILADNGSNWYISGVPDSRWNDDTLVGELKLVKGSNFEAVDESSLMVDPDSGRVKTTTTTIGSSTTTTTSNPALVLNKPNGGESWNRNAQRVITWNASGCQGNLKITLWQNGGLINTIADNINPDAGSYSWTVGAYSGGTAPLGTGYSIKIADNNSSLEDSSDTPFSIVKISVKAPNGGESWQINTMQNITWTAKSITNNLRIVLFKDGVKVGNIVNSLSPLTSSYAWTTGSYVGGTATAGTSYQVQVREIGTDAGDRSDATFTLTAH